MDLLLNRLLPDGFDGKRKARKIREFIKQSSLMVNHGMKQNKEASEDIRRYIYLLIYRTSLYINNLCIHMRIYVILAYVLYLYKERYQDGKVNGLISER